MTHNLKAKQAAPATPLPWIAHGDSADRMSIRQAEAGPSVASMFLTRNDADDAAYIVAACNAYPRLMAEREQLIRVVRHFAAMPDILSVAENEQIASLLRQIEGAE